MGEFFSKEGFLRGKDNIKYSIESGVRLWMQEAFLEKILQNILEMTTKGELLHLHVLMLNGFTEFQISFRNPTLRLETLFEHQNHAFLKDLIESVGAQIQMERQEEQVRISLLFPLKGSYLQGYSSLESAL